MCMMGDMKNVAVEELAAKIVEAAGQGGGIEEVARIASHGWPASRQIEAAGLDSNDEPALRGAVQAEAKRVIRSTEADE